MDKFTELTLPSSLTVMQAVSPAVPMTKIFDAEGSKSYQNAFKFNAVPMSFDSIDSLYDVITKVQTNKHICIVRGSLKSEGKETGIQRKIKGEDAKFEDRPSKLIHLDIDGVSAPEGMEMTEWAEYIISLLPLEFQESSYFSQYSSSAGVKSGIRLHLWFYSAFFFDNAGFKRWYTYLSDEQQRIIDDSMFRPVQINYVVPPIFLDGRIDPVEAAGLDRMKLVKKEFDTVALDIPAEAKELPQISRRESNEYIDQFELPIGSPMNAFYRALWVVESSGRLHIPILQAMSAYRWACNTMDVEPDEEEVIERVRESILRSNHPEKEGIYVDEEYLQNQYDSSN